MKDDQLMPKGFSVLHKLPIVLCLVMGVSNLIISISFNSERSDYLIYIMMAFPFIFVGMMFDIYLKVIKSQNERIEEFENRIMEMQD